MRTIDQNHDTSTKTSCVIKRLNCTLTISFSRLAVAAWGLVDFISLQTYFSWHISTICLIGMMNTAEAGMWSITANFIPSVSRASFSASIIYRNEAMSLWITHWNWDRKSLARFPILTYVVQHTNAKNGIFSENPWEWWVNRCIRVLDFFATEMDFGREICSTTQERGPKKHLHFRSRSATEITRTEFRDRK